MIETTRWGMSDSQYGRSPVICIDFHSRIWLVWISCGSFGESILACHCDPYSDVIWSEPRVLVPARRAITGLTTAPYRDGIVSAWTEEGPDGGLKIIDAGRDWEGVPRHLISDKAAPAHPSLAADQTGFALFWTVRDVFCRRVEGVWGDSVEKELEIRRISEKGRKSAFPRAAVKNGTVAVVWQEMTAESAAVLFCAIDQFSLALSVKVLREDKECSVALPNVAAASDGFWVVWQSERDPSAGPELVRGVEVLHVADDGTLSRPGAKMPHLDRRGKEEDQGFEFPVPVCAADGRLIILGRGSQSIRRLDLGCKGWADVGQLDDPGWQCRGRLLSAITSPTHVWWALREKGTVVVRRSALADHVSGRPVLAQLLSAPVVYQKISSEKPRNLIFGGFRVLFGDIHQHTAGSDGTGTAEEAYFRARVRYGDRVVCVTDHESFLGKRTFDGEWKYACRVADEYYDPGSFVTLKGFEWTGKMHPGPGHKVVYLPTSGGPVLSRDDPKTDTSLGLMRECRALGALAIPHHVGWTGADMAHHAGDVQTCWEIVSCHGAYERADAANIGTRGDDKDGQFIADALDKNLRFGLVGGSDGHGLSRHHGVSRKQDSHRTGLTGFLSHDVSREAVLEALRKRRCFATSGAKIALWFEVDGRPMGEEVIAGYDVSFRISAVGTEMVRHVCLVTNGGLEIPLTSNGITVDAHGTLPPPPDNGFSYYFVRLTQEDGEVAWSSPVWLDPPGPA